MARGRNRAEVDAPAELEIELLGRHEFLRCKWLDRPVGRKELAEGTLSARNQPLGIDKMLLRKGMNIDLRLGHCIHQESGPTCMIHVDMGKQDVPYVARLHPQRREPL